MRRLDDYLEPLDDYAVLVLYWFLCLYFGAFVGLLLALGLLG